MTNNPHLLEVNNTINIADIRNTLREAVAAAAEQTLPLFRTKLAIDNKYAVGFDPVTEADRNAETAIRAVITKHFPDHAIIGEEWENKESDSPFAWIIDPVDGTRAFVSGVPVWGTLIGVTYKGRAFAGIMSQPFTGETYLAGDGKAELIHNGQTTELQASSVTSLAEATLFTTTPSLFSKPGQRAGYDAVEAEVQLARYGCDCYAYALLASGHVDLILEPGMNTYDIAALVPLIENAGGLVTTWAGERAEVGGDIIAAATPELHEAALAIMRQHVA